MIWVKFDLLKYDSIISISWFNLMWWRFDMIWPWPMADMLWYGSGYELIWYDMIHDMIWSWFNDLCFYPKYGVNDMNLLNLNRYDSLTSCTWNILDLIFFFELVCFGAWNPCKCQWSNGQCRHPYLSTSYHIIHLTYLWTITITMTTTYNLSLYHCITVKVKGLLQLQHF